MLLVLAMAWRVRTTIAVCACAILHGVARLVVPVLSLCIALEGAEVIEQKHL